LEGGTVTSVLYDHPGPRTIARHRVYAVVGLVLLILPVAFVVWRMADRGMFAYELWEPFVTPAYLEVLLFEGVWNTLQMAFLSIIFAVVFGLVLGVGKLSEHAWIRWPSWLVVEFFRAVPVLLLMVFVFFSYGVGDGFGAYWSVVIALTLYNGSVLAEVFRAGINAVPSGQAEAAYAIGMRKTQVMTIILLPQAVKIMLPAIISQMVVALKDTSLGYYITAPGLTFVGRQIYGEFGNQLPTVMVVAALYILVNLILTWVATWIQHRLVGEKETLSVGEAGLDRPAGVAGTGGPAQQG
jgi:glutamate transport system permease protein